MKNEKLEILEKVAKENGYEVLIDYEKTRFEVRPIFSDVENYLPKIYDDTWLDKKLSVKIQTTSYGALNFEEFEKFQKAQKAAFAVAKAFEDFLKTN